MPPRARRGDAAKARSPRIRRLDAGTVEQGNREMHLSARAPRGFSRSRASFLFLRSPSTVAGVAARQSGRAAKLVFLGQASPERGLVVSLPRHAEDLFLWA